MPLVLKEKLGLCQERAEWPGVGGQEEDQSSRSRLLPREFPPSPVPRILYAPMFIHTPLPGTEPAQASQVALGVKGEITDGSRGSAGWTGLNDSQEPPGDQNGLRGTRRPGFQPPYHLWDSGPVHTCPWGFPALVQ